MGTTRVGKPRILPRVNFTVDEKLVRAYFEAVCDQTALCAGEFVPPMAVVALAKKEVMHTLHLPDGGVQTHADCDFLGLVMLGDTIECAASVAKPASPSSLNFFTVSMRAVNQNHAPIFKAKMGFLFPAGRDTGL